MGQASLAKCMISCRGSQIPLKRRPKSRDMRGTPSKYRWKFFNEQDSMISRSFLPGIEFVGIFEV
jgi:hypothetical protein